MTDREVTRDAARAGTFALGGDLEVNRLGYGAMRITGDGIWGEPDDGAWERAHAHYLAQFERFSDIQEERPLPLAELEAGCGCR